MTKANYLLPTAYFLFFYMFVSLISGCRASEPLEPISTPFPTVAVGLEADLGREGLLLIVMDGVPRRELESWIDESALANLRTKRSASAFATLAEGGYFVGVESVEPTLAESGLVTLLTGKSPFEHQWVGLLDSYEPPPIVPFWANEDDVYTVLIGSWPGMSPELADVGIGSGEQVLDHALHEPLLAPAQVWEGAPPSFSPRLEAILPLSYQGQQVDQLFLLAVDTLNDNLMAYDQYWLTTERRIGADDVWLDALKPGWVTVRLDEQVAVEVLLREGRADALQLYQSPAQRLIVWPEGLSLPTPSPPELDLEAYYKGWLSKNELKEMALRQTRWLAETAITLWDAAPSDKRPLLAVRWAAIGALDATLLLVDPTQAGWEYTEQRHFLNIRQQLLADTDKTLATLISQIDLSRHTLFVTSPVGVEPVWYDMSVPLLLEEGGLNPEYYNIQTNEKIAWLGVKANAPTDALIEASKLFVMMSDEATQQLLFEKVRKGEEMIGKGGEGWLFIQGRAGYLLSTRRDGDSITATSRLGGTGGSPQNPDLSGWWLAYGQQVRPRHDQGLFSVIDISEHAKEIIRNENWQ